MKIHNNLISTIVLLAIGCGGGNDVGTPGGDGPKEASGIWGRAGDGALAKDVGAVTESVRTLTFDDGMVVSYDGSDTETGEEEVCRRHSAQGQHYEVCMPLEDDPFFIPPQTNALVWRPLLFERFSTELACRTWRDGDEAKTPSDCDTVLPLFSGEEDFHCEAGVVNGDKALKCSDQWAVVVNGDADDTKTVCRVHTVSGDGRCLAAPKRRTVVEEDGTEIEEDVPDAELILVMQKSSWEGYSSGQINERQFVEGESVVTSVPQDIPSGAEMGWHSSDEDICTVDGETGTVTIGENLNLPVHCKILLKITAKSYADRVLFARLPVFKGNDTGWEDYTLQGDVLYVGETLVAGGLTHTEPASPQLLFESLDDSICTIDASSGTLMAVAPGSCDVRLTSKAADHLDAVVEKSVVVTALSTSLADIVWSDFPAAAAVGVDTGRLGSPQVQDSDGNAVARADLTTTVAHVSGDCTWDGTDRDISFAGVTECVLSVTAQKRGEEDYTKEFRVTPSAGVFTLSWTGYAAGATFGGTAPALNAPSVTPALSEVEYEYAASGGGCRVDGASGALTLVAASGGGTSCDVTLRASRADYTLATVARTIVISKADQSFAVPVAPYGAAISVQNGLTHDLLNPPEGGIGTLLYQRAGGDCTVNAANGRITANASGSNPCRVAARWGGNDNYNPSPLIVIATVSVVGTANDGALCGEVLPMGALQRWGEVPCPSPPVPSPTRGREDWSTEALVVSFARWMPTVL